MITNVYFLIRLGQAGNAKLKKARFWKVGQRLIWTPPVTIVRSSSAEAVFFCGGVLQTGRALPVS
jgi:hypothetical protein